MSNVQLRTHLSRPERIHDNLQNLLGSLQVSLQNAFITQDVTPYDIGGVTVFVIIGGGGALWSSPSQNSLGVSISGVDSNLIDIPTTGKYELILNGAVQINGAVPAGDIQYRIGLGLSTGAAPLTGAEITSTMSDNAPFRPNSFSQSGIFDLTGGTSLAVFVRTDLGGGGAPLRFEDLTVVIRRIS